MYHEQHCKRTNLCVDCDDKNCLHVGDKYADCPKYVHMCPDARLNGTCEGCGFIDDHIAHERSKVRTYKF